jgi:CubicO group peptidase (beta-lactamase class C family)
MRTHRPNTAVVRLRQLTCAALVAVPLGATRPAQARAQEPFPGLDAYITKAVAMWKVPGLSVAIVRNDSVLYAKGFGVLAAGSTTPVNEKTLFEIGSSSKAFTATVAAMLVGDGKMRWDERLTTYLPDFRMYDAVANEGVTLRDALTHRSGIARGELVWLGANISRDEVLHRVRFLKPEAPFRSHYSYQNMMFLAAGQAEGKAAGTTWDELVRTRIFVPLGMTSSVTSSKGLENANVATPHGMDHDTPVRKPQFDGENIGPAGAIMSNAVDMAQWLRFQLNDGQVAGKRLVNSAAFRETHTPQIVIPGGMGGGRGGAADSLPPATHFHTYGMGWMVEDYRGQYTWQHGGNTPGMTTAVGVMPDKHLGVVVLSNMQSAQLPELLRQYIFDRAVGAPMRDLSGEAFARYAVQRKRADSVEKAQAIEHSANATPPLPLTAYEGTYADSLYGDATVSIKDGHLELVRGEWRAPLEYWNATNFRWNASSVTGPMFIKFEVGPDNSVTGLYFGIQGDVTLLNRKGAGRGGRGGRGGTP